MNAVGHPYLSGKGGDDFMQILGHECHENVAEKAKRSLLVVYDNRVTPGRPRGPYIVNNRLPLVKKAATSRGVV